MALALILGMGSMAQGQAASGATPEYNPGPTLPMIDGNFQYSLFASEVAQTGYTNGVTSTTNFGGTLEYLSPERGASFQHAVCGRLSIHDPTGNRQLNLPELIDIAGAGTRRLGPWGLRFGKLPSERSDVRADRGSGDWRNRTAADYGGQHSVADRADELLPTREQLRKREHRAKHHPENVDQRSWQLRNTAISRQQRRRQQPGHQGR